jgi:hypothetical protein
MLFFSLAPVAQLDRATDFESDSGIFYIFCNHGKNRTNASQATFCTILSIAGNSVCYHVFWCRDGTEMAQSEKRGVIQDESPPFRLY